MDGLTVIPDNVVRRADVFTLEHQILALPQVELKVVHHFGHKTYARELHIPKGCTLTGAIQKFANVNILSKGDITVLTKDGMRRVQAPFTEVSPAGMKRVGYAHEDCVWTTIFSTEETDPEKVVDYFTTNDPQLFLDHCAQLERK